MISEKLMSKVWEAYQGDPMDPKNNTEAGLRRVVELVLWEAPTLGYANVYKEEDGTQVLGSGDIDNIHDLYPWAAQFMEHVGIAEIRLLPNSSEKSGTEYLFNNS